MPTGRSVCPVCRGNGVVKENAKEYEFITRDPITAKCLVCNGRGWLNARTKLPNGEPASSILAGDKRELRREKVEMSRGREVSGDLRSPADGDVCNPERRLNVSKKAVVNPEAVDTGVGYEGSREVERSRGREESPLTPNPSPARGEGENAAAPRFLEMALNPRLNKVLASGKQFLIVTETEPYYLDVYRMIRQQERDQGTWTEEDEERFVDAMDLELEMYKMRCKLLLSGGSAGLKEGLNAHMKVYCKILKEVTNA